MTDTNILSPDAQAWLNATFDRNRRKYAGLTMMADGEAGDDADKGDGTDSGETTKGSNAKEEAKPKTGSGEKGDEQLGEGGKKALEAEREERKKLKGELDQFKNSLAEALGIKTEKGDGDGNDLVTTLQQKVEGMQREAAVLKLANEHKITDKDDLELLGSTSDDATREALAKRLAPGENGNGAPKPDRTQGGGGSAGEKTTTGSVKSAREDYLERHKKKTA
ncbi:hypothetical protein [Aeromicrobium piscarium]|uniref:Scaffolding protein n=1 Tax=Aeromicrobium piscarium TaxID=2590901 RepID=A0A554SP39_9ACTN|nr:hypothetical protein [Aeromicrobium piscarium]TSD68125.1 hypothetical protein FNM00_00575 [Aeromicrobium piscarium]